MWHIYDEVRKFKSLEKKAVCQKSRSHLTNGQTYIGRYSENVAHLEPQAECLNFLTG